MRGFQINANTFFPPFSIERNLSRNSGISIYLLLSSPPFFFFLFFFFFFFFFPFFAIDFEILLQEIAEQGQILDVTSLRSYPCRYTSAPEKLISCCIHKGIIITIATLPSCDMIVFHDKHAKPHIHLHTCGPPHTHTYIQIHINV